MFVGSSTLHRMHVYLLGYPKALSDNGLLRDSGKQDPFFDWVANRLGYFESTAGWANMILASALELSPKEVEWETYNRETTPAQHEKSVRLFYELLEEFINSSIKLKTQRYEGFP